MLTISYHFITNNGPDQNITRDVGCHCGCMPRKTACIDSQVTFQFNFKTVPNCSKSSTLILTWGQLWYQGKMRNLGSSPGYLEEIQLQSNFCFIRCFLKLWNTYQSYVCMRTRRDIWYAILARQGCSQSIQGI